MKKSDKKNNLKNNKLAYRQVVNPELAKRLYILIYQRIIIDKKYLDPNYSAKVLATDLNTNTRYLSAIINSYFNKNFSTLVNELRIRDAKKILRSTRYKKMRIEDVGLKVGFSTRQCFYTAFNKYAGVTPRQYRTMINRE